MSSKKLDESKNVIKEPLDIVIEKPKRTKKVKLPVQVPDPEPEPEPDSEEEPPEPIDAPKNDVITPTFKKRKEHKKTEWVLTPARAENIKKAQARLRERNAHLAEEKAKKDEEERKILEAKVIKKAIALKKKQLKKEAVIDDIPEDVPLRPRPKAMEYVPKYKYL